MKVCVLASGSAANCIYVAGGGTGILVDGGLSGKETARRLQEIGADLKEVQAVCLTHEHDDHCASLSVLHDRHGLAVYANAGTIEAVERGRRRCGVRWNVFTTGASFRVGALTIEPFPVPHDSYEPVGFVIEADGQRLGLVTDMGMPTGLVRDRLKPCGVIAIEANHDEQLLRDAERPRSLKQRIAGRQGHLSNTQAGDLIADVAGPGLKAVFLAHLSVRCNRPELAFGTVRRRLSERGVMHVELKMTYPDKVSEVIEL